MRHYWRKILPIIKIGYKSVSDYCLLFSLLVFSSLMSITWFRRNHDWNNKSELEARKAWYLEGIDDMKAEQERFRGDDATLERMARERYYMKKSNEDLYILIDEVEARPTD